MQSKWKIVITIKTLFLPEALFIPVEIDFFIS